MTLLRLLSLLLCLAAPVWAGEPAQGLIRAATSLPRTLPLHLRIAPGVNAWVVLRDPASKAEVLAAYGRGGTLLRVLVPPGDWLVDLATGATWLGEAQLFGPATRVQHLGPLRFEVKGLRQRRGHLIEVYPEGRAVLAGLRAIATCQGWQPDLRFTPVTPDPPDPRRDPDPPRRTYTFPCG